MVDERKLDLVRQLGRQLAWLRESWRWLLITKVIKEGARPRSLDVGCGPGIVMEALSDLMDIRGIDHDPDMISICKAKDLKVRLGFAENLPYKDDRFDIVYCSFVMLWQEDPIIALKEMKRVSKDWVICLAEPDFGARIDHPEELDIVRKILIDGVRKQGGDPLMGRRLRSLYQRSGIALEMGVHGGIWDIERSDQEFDDEWRFFKGLASSVPDEEMERIERIWKRALNDKTLFQFNPIFYALGRK